MLRLPAIALLGLLGSVPGLAATPSDAAPAPAGGHPSQRERILGFLPKAEQDRVIAAHDKALADNPKLRREDAALRTEGRELQNESSKDRQAYIEKRRVFDQKLRQAMLKEDPTLGPVLDRIDKHLSAMRARWQREMDAAPGGN